MSALRKWDTPQNVWELFHIKKQTTKKNQLLCVFIFWRLEERTAVFQAWRKKKLPRKHSKYKPNSVAVEFAIETECKTTNLGGLLSIEVPGRMFQLNIDKKIFLALYLKHIS